MITPEEQIELAREYLRSRDRKLEDRLVQSQLGLVHKLAQQYRRPRDHDDLIQEGCLGVIHAVRHFDPERGVRLSSYTAWWIRAYQLRWLVANHRLVRVGKTALQRRAFFEARALRSRLSAAGLEPTVADLASRMGVDAERLASDLDCIDAREVDIDGPSDLISAVEGADDRLGAAEAQRLLGDELSRFMKTLDRRERSIVQARWLRDSPLTLREMGRKLSVSRERIRQLEGRLFQRIRRRLPADLAQAA
jgi:RNA polymerase sigma-32 factor